MEIQSTALPEVKLLVPRVMRDERGFFAETYNQRTLQRVAGIDMPFVQDNQSRSEHRGTIRGLHFQSAPHAQDKLIRVLSGAIFDVAVDIRVGSPTYGQHAAMTLSADNQMQAWIPRGFAHGFCTLEPGTEVLYKVTDYYDPTCDKGLAWDDPQLAIAWPVAAAEAILSAKDRTHPRLASLPTYFTAGSVRLAMTGP